MPMNYSDFKNLGLFRASVMTPEVAIGDPETNINNILKMIEENPGNELYLFPELSVTGYTAADLFNQSVLLDTTEKCLGKLAHRIPDSHAIVVVGAPIRSGNKLFNCAIVLQRDSILAVIPKKFIPNYNEFYERRWFSSGNELRSPHRISFSDGQHTFESTIYPEVIIEHNNAKIGFEICEDLWIPVPPSCRLAIAGADILCNLSASNEIIGKHNYLLNLISQQSARCRCAYLYSSAGTGESSTDLVFSGNAIIAEDGNIIAESERFQRGQLYVSADIDLEKLRNDRIKFNSFAQDGIDTNMEVPVIKTYSCKERPHLNITIDNLIRKIASTPFVPQSEERRNESCEEIINIQCWGLMQRLEAIGHPKIVIGISGGLDSTLALLVACRTCDKMNIGRENIIGITMPGLATTAHTKSNAVRLMEELGVTSLEIPINKAIKQHFEDISQDPEKHDAAFENSQARERTQILMDYANKCGGIVLGTGDLSELALGWATYNGDHISMYGVNASIPKTLVRYLVKWFADNTTNDDERKTLHSIIETPISPELIPANNQEEIVQRTEDLVGPYVLHDFFLYNMLRNGYSPRKIFTFACFAFKDVYDADTILKWEKTFYRRFFSQQFKRSCLPDGPKVGSVCLSPRGDWRMPSDATVKLWLKDLENIDSNM